MFSLLLKDLISDSYFLPNAQTVGQAAAELFMFESELRAKVS